MAPGAPPREARVVSRLTLSPGQYSVRVAGTGRPDGLEGSVLYDLEVPDLRKGDVTVSGIALSSRQTSAVLTGGPDRNWHDQQRDPPTTTRRFTATDEIGVYVEIYDNRKRPLPIDLTATIADGNGTAVLSRREQLPPEAAGGRHAFRIRVPPGAMKPGPHLLTMQAASGDVNAKPVTRAVSFSIAE